MNARIEENQRIELEKHRLLERLCDDATDNEGLMDAIAASASDRHAEVAPLVNWLWARLIEFSLEARRRAN